MIHSGFGPAGADSIIAKTTPPYVFIWPSFSPSSSCAAARPSSCSFLSAPALPLALLMVALVVLAQVQLLVQALVLVLLSLLLSLVPVLEHRLRPSNKQAAL
jgi:hypothetical protein